MRSPSGAGWTSGTDLACPNCGREQKCGCEICHACGVPVVSRAAPTKAGEPGDEQAVPETPGEYPESLIVEPAFGEEPAGVGARVAAARALPACATIFGVAILLVAFVELFHLAGDFQGQSVSAATTLGSLKTMGYYMGHILYGNSVRLLVGSGLLSIGLLLSPPRPFASPGFWRRSTRIAGILFGTLSAICLLGCILLLLPGAGRLELLTTNLVPELPVTVLVMLVTAAGLGSGGYLLVVETHEERRDDA